MGIIQGVVLINASTEKYKQLISEKISVAGCEKYVLDVSLSFDQLQTILANPPGDNWEDSCNALIPEVSSSYHQEVENFL